MKTVDRVLEPTHKDSNTVAYKVRPVLTKPQRSVVVANDECLFEDVS